ncbi:DUF2637 domain-containing protein [Streptomyces sp. NPDC093992]|uniref:DUF2637 domain-containing protein n=1 Tax=Streptomyces sp. NPDC093992 TaxID=3366053 RepID=UPI00383907DB
MVVTGAVLIAGIGFAGSYTAVRELALKKGFGDFSYVFPIGIDAGICVLLALDLLLTWIRIPFPLLRQTAWLLTAATIAFNGAAAWPDPLGVGMHAVIPVLFVVSVEAARHAIGRIADITADKHMEGVRLTRWLLSPVPTFLLWRRMKLWELRSYDQVIKLEQARLVYQASLRSRFGRNWRRKAPVEALMPLRLARYGVPLAETAPAGLAAAGITEPPLILTAEAVNRTSAPAQPEHSEPGLAVTVAHETAELELEKELFPRPGTAEAPEQPVGPRAPVQEVDERFAEAYQAFLAQFQAEPTAAQWALWLRDAYGISTGTGNPLSESQVQPLLQVLQQRYAPEPKDPAAVSGPDLEEPQSADQSWYDYFLSAWRAYHQEQGVYPDAAALAAHVYERDAITGTGGRPVTAQDLAEFVALFQRHESGSGEAPADEAAAGSGAQDDPEIPEQKTGPGGPEQQTGPDPTPADMGTQAAQEQRGPRVSVPVEDPPSGSEEVPGERPAVTTVDRYYLAWVEYQSEHGGEPTDEQLSAYLAEKGMYGRGKRPVSPATLRRHLLPFRVYNVWAEYRIHDEQPAAGTVAQECAARGITGQYHKPLSVDYLTQNTADFERRWQALTHHADAQH